MTKTEIGHYVTEDEVQQLQELEWTLEDLFHGEITYPIVEAIRYPKREENDQA